MLPNSETIQNSAIPIILGFHRTAKATNLRHELGLPFVADRIREIYPTTAVRLIKDSRERIPKLELLAHHGFDTVAGIGWAVFTARDIIYYNVVDHLSVGTVTHDVPPWDKDTLDVRLLTIQHKKQDMAANELIADCLHIIHDMVRGYNTLEQIYYS